MLPWEHKVLSSSVPCHRFFCHFWFYFFFLVHAGLRKKWNNILIKLQTCISSFTLQCEAFWTFWEEKLLQAGGKKEFSKTEAVKEKWKTTSCYQSERFKRVGALVPWDFKKGCVGLIGTYPSFFSCFENGKHHLWKEKKEEPWVLCRLLSVLTCWGKREKGEPACATQQCIRKWAAVSSVRPKGFSWASLASHLANAKVISLSFGQILGCRNCSFVWGSRLLIQQHKEQICD